MRSLPLSVKYINFIGLLFTAKRFYSIGPWVRVSMAITFSRSKYPRWLFSMRQSVCDVIRIATGHDVTDDDDDVASLRTSQTRCRDDVTRKMTVTGWLESMRRRILGMRLEKYFLSINYQSMFQWLKAYLSIFGLCWTLKMPFCCKGPIYFGVLAIQCKKLSIKCPP